MKHRGHGQNRVLVAYAKSVHRAFRQRMKHQCAVRINHSLGKSRRPGCKTHRRTVVFTNLRKHKIRIASGEQFFVIQIFIWHRSASVRNDNDFFKRRFRAKFVEHRQQHIIYQQKTIACMFRNRSDFMRMQPQIQCMKDAARAGHAEKRFQMANVIPHHGGHAVAAAQAELAQRTREPRGALAECPVVRTKH